MPKFVDIPRYVRDGNYCVDIPLDYLEEAYRRYREDYGLDLDVDFQRAHVWTDAQATAFVEHILRGGRGSETIRFNMPGWGSGEVATAGEPTAMVCVDGKQRLTAVLRFLRDEIPAFGHLFGEYEDRPRMVVTGLKFMVNDLSSRREVLRWYLDINTGGTAHTDAELAKVRRLLEAEKA